MSRATKQIVLSSEEEKVLNLFVQFGAPATVEEIHGALQTTFTFGIFISFRFISLKS
jgi:hypothetical protein